MWLGGLLGVLVDWRFGLAAGLFGAGIGAAALVMRGESERARWFRRGAGWSLVVCGILLAVPVTLRVHSAQTDPLRLQALVGAHADLRVTITQRPRPVFSPGFGGRPSGVTTDVITAEVIDARADGQVINSHGSVLLLAPVAGWSSLLPGQQVTAHGTLAPARSGDLTVAVLKVRGPPERAGPAPVWQRAAGSLRAGLHSASSAVLSPEPAGLLPALVVGDTDEVSKQVQDEFRVAGLSHLLAVSGANLAILCVAVLLLLRAARVGPRCAAVGAMAATVGFVLLAGPEPSVLRAAVMAAAGLLALALGRERAALPALAASIIVLVAYDPAMAVSAGFALSVLATAALVLLAPRWSTALSRRGVPVAVAEAIAVPAAAHVVTAPVIAGLSGQISLVAIVANLVVAPVVAPVTVLGVLVAVVAPIAGWPAELLARLAGPEVGWLITVARHAAAVPGATISWPGGWLGGALLAVILAGLFIALRHRRTRVVVGAVLGALLLVVVPIKVIAPGWPPPGWAIVACDVGQGDALVLATADPGRAVVVDTGPDPGPVGSCLDRLDVSRVPLVVLSHLHADHVGGLAAVLDGRSVGAVAVGPARVPGWAWHQVQQETAAAKVPLVQLAVGEHLQWPGLGMDVLGPEPAEATPRTEADGTEINNSSVVLKATTPAGRILLTGDVELSAQADLLSAGVDLSADIVKVPHHGSRYTAPAFLDAVHARVGLVSVGAGNPYGHPSPTTLAVLATRGVMVLRTDQDGDAAVLPGPTIVRRGHHTILAVPQPRAPPRPTR
ncbi:DNA internalization-related competence protein ComEC/Rec2 [Labedaea rhizosphaerae]|uniref:Competence protein ComEC n=1 Tax=Labedaea rhizosphaerae TaxID=598644 RepID=A0A4R6SA78_LABRH|nr:DNA internalization-related competence protein ComEC/Rec2 [Labedaea rhizosphaerae]TDP96307.1 competence protein ComEC [Labedaea rhizosphaerae]